MNFVSCADLAESIPNGSKIAIFKESSVPVKLGLELIKKKKNRLHIVTVPTGGFLIDLLIGNGCVETIETSGVSLGEYGPAPRFTDALLKRQIKILDSTCPAIYAGLQAAQSGNPFAVIRGLIGSDILKQRRDYKIIKNPFNQQDKIVCVESIKPDFTIFHAEVADQQGNVFYGNRRELELLAHASKKTFVTVERIATNNLLEKKSVASMTLPAFYVSGIAKVPSGARPLELHGLYPPDRSKIREYAKAATTDIGFKNWFSSQFS